MQRTKRALIFTSLMVLTISGAAPAHGGEPLEGTAVRSSVTLTPVGNHSTKGPLAPEAPASKFSGSRAVNQGGGKPYMPLDEALAEQRATNQFHDVQPTSNKGAKALAVDPDEDWPTKDECVKEWEEGNFEGEWQYHNNYSACQVYMVYFDFQECTTIPPVICKSAGQTEARAVILGKGWGATRAVDWDIHLDNWRKVWGTEYPNQQFKIDVECVTYQRTDQCDSKASTRRVSGQKEKVR